MGSDHSTLPKNRRVSLAQLSFAADESLLALASVLLFSESDIDGEGREQGEREREREP